MRKAAALIVTALLAALALACAALWLHRAALPYNDQGRYFDAAESVVYTDNAVIVFAMLALLFGVAALGSAVWLIRSWRR